MQPGISDELTPVEDPDIVPMMILSHSPNTLMVCLIFPRSARSGLDTLAQAQMDHLSMEEPVNALAAADCRCSPYLRPWAKPIKRPEGFVNDVGFHASAVLVFAWFPSQESMANEGLVACLRCLAGALADGWCLLRRVFHWQSRRDLGRRHAFGDEGRRSG